MKGMKAIRIDIAAAALALRKVIEMADMKPDCVAVAGTDSSACRVGDADLAEVLLASGLAAVRADAPAYYRAAERRARAVPLGIWRTHFVTPAEWPPAVTPAAG